MFTGWLQGPGEKMSPMGDQNENVKKMGSPEVAPQGTSAAIHAVCTSTQLEPK